ncbi:MAG: hypothetical protein LIO59_01985 [Oscillospiraceae bacterium]|nr:hypothetical protein [Oscillospiraceae bacterium]
MRKFFEETLSKAMRLSFALTCSALLFFGMCINMSSASAADIEIGSYIEMGTYYGESILWRCVGFERISGYDDNGNPIIDSTDTSTEYREVYLPLKRADKIICLKPFDAKTSSDSETGSHGRRANIDNCGSNYWADSNMRSWLNSSESAGEVTWLCGNPPAGELAGTYSLVGSNPYDMEAGFLTNFSQEEISAAEAVAQKSIAAYPEYESGIYDSGSELFICNKDIDNAVQNYRDAYSETVTDTMFLLDVKQANEVYANSGVLGEDYYIGEPTQQCIENSEYVSYSTGSENK